MKILRITSASITMEAVPCESSDELVTRFSYKGPSECSCEACVAMCERTPCLGTPEDIERLMDSGLMETLWFTEWHFGVPHGVPVIRMVQVKQLSTGCPFLKDRKCVLHDLALKPTEGRLASCKGPFHFAGHPSVAVALTWILPCNAEKVNGLFSRLTAYAERSGRFSS